MAESTESNQNLREKRGLHQCYAAPSNPRSETPLNERQMNQDDCNLVTQKVNPGYLSFLSSFLPPLPSPCLADGIWYWSCPVLLTTVLSVPLTRSQASGHLAFMS
ncbi:hypothetical protein CBS147482_8603 [Aspergillus niger]|nr:hypothetical protein CBS115988_9722 [Aspergillus niger]KAI2993792.1 hypothetical protein CBS147482_8603 [Aspergillus niger]KAI3018049.1 hypothetical protein CBS147345_4304 [Aspergillus niger]KAI3039410.1 hypothetical protein CBS147352_10357 [Aspergillus niger]